MQASCQREYHTSFANIFAGASTSSRAAFHRLFTVYDFLISILLLNLQQLLSQSHDVLTIMSVTVTFTNSTYALYQLLVRVLCWVPALSLNDLTRCVPVHICASNL